eukprot:5474712-Prymnesium_polylepis.3
MCGSVIGVPMAVGHVPTCARNRVPWLVDLPPGVAWRHASPLGARLHPSDPMVNRRGWRER